MKSVLQSTTHLINCMSRHLLVNTPVPLSSIVSQELVAVSTSYGLTPPGGGAVDL
jgi:hypothetical protein